MKQPSRASHTCWVLGNSNAKVLTSSLFTSQSKNSMADSDQHFTSPDFLSCHVNNVS